MTLERSLTGSASDMLRTEVCIPAHFRRLAAGVRRRWSGMRLRARRAYRVHKCDGPSDTRSAPLARRDETDPKAECAPVKVRLSHRGNGLSSRSGSSRFNLET